MSRRAAGARNPHAGDAASRAAAHRSTAAEPDKHPGYSDARRSIPDGGFSGVSMNESKLAPSRANMYAHLGAQYCFNLAPQASAGNYIVGELHTERSMLTREQIAARCRKQRLEAGLPVHESPKVRSRQAQPSQRDAL